MKKSKLKQRTIQAMLLNIKPKNYNIVMARLYSPTKHNIKAERYIQLFKNTGNRFIIGGDLTTLYIHTGDRGL